MSQWPIEEMPKEVLDFLRKANAHRTTESCFRQPTRRRFMPCAQRKISYLENERLFPLRWTFVFALTRNTNLPWLT